MYLWLSTKKAISEYRNSDFQISGFVISIHKNIHMQSLLDELDVIEYYQQPGKTRHLSETTNKQLKLYEIMEIPAPT